MTFTHLDAFVEKLGSNTDCHKLESSTADLNFAVPSLSFLMNIRRQLELAYKTSNQEFHSQGLRVSVLMQETMHTRCVLTHKMCADGMFLLVRTQGNKMSNYSQKIYTSSIKHTTKTTL